MARGDGRLERRVSNLTIFAAAAAVATAAAAAWQPDLDAGSIAFSTGMAQPALTSAGCREADRTAVAQFATFLERNGPTDAPVLERALHTLNLARRHCLYDWDDRALDDYRWLGRWLDEHS